MATLLLLKEAYHNNANQWFVLCSEDIFPVRTYDEFNSYLGSKTKSLFSDMNKDNRIKTPNTIFKTQQWWALTRKDVELLLTALNIKNTTNNNTNNTSIDYVKNQPLFINIAKGIPKKAAWDELFFLSAFKMIQKNNNNIYDYNNRTICYTKWFDEWVSKHPTIFNQLLPTDKEFIEQHNSCFFIRKTFPTFKNEVVAKKNNCIIVVIGTANQDIPDYTKFLSMYQQNSDIFLLVMTSISDIKSSDIKQACCQCYFVVWNMVEDASNKLKRIMETQEKYSKVFIIPENTNANEFDIPELKSVWVKLLSKKYNQYYWFNNITGESSWEDPDVNVKKGGLSKKIKTKKIKTKKTKTKKIKTKKIKTKKTKTKKTKSKKTKKQSNKSKQSKQSNKSTKTK